MKPVTNYETGTVVASAQLDVSPQLAYKALTEPAIFEQWWDSDDTYHMKDWIADVRPGGHYTTGTFQGWAGGRPQLHTCLSLLNQAPYSPSFIKVSPAAIKQPALMLTAGNVLLAGCKLI